MKMHIKLILSIAIVSLALSALVTQTAKAEESACLYTYSVAEEIMYNRQHGATLPDMVEKFHDDEARVALVKEAYTYQVMNLESNKEASINKFAEWSFNQCDKHQ